MLEILAKMVDCQGPASLGRIQGYPEEERRRRERETERPDLGCAAESGRALFFTIDFIP